jgi:hypothetical protein
MSRNGPPAFHHVDHVCRPAEITGAKDSRAGLPSRSPGGAGDAEGYYREALVLADTPARRPLPPRPRQLSRRTGQREQAQEHLITATTMYREMDMRFWLERAEAEMRELA